jgi:hypothetical protein
MSAGREEELGDDGKWLVSRCALFGENNRRSSEKVQRRKQRRQLVVHKWLSKLRILDPLGSRAGDFSESKARKFVRHIWQTSTPTVIMHIKLAPVLRTLGSHLDMLSADQSLSSELPRWTCSGTSRRGGHVQGNPNEHELETGVRRQAHAPNEREHLSP